MLICAWLELALTCVLSDLIFSRLSCRGFEFVVPPCLDGMIVRDLELGRRDRSPSSPPRKARRRDQDNTLVSDGMDWNNLMTWQHNPSYNAPNAFPMTQSNYQPNPSSSQLYQHPPVNYMMPFSPEPAPAKTVKSMLPPPGHAQVHLRLAIRPRCQCSLRRHGLLHRKSGNLVTACWTRTSSTPSACQ